MTPRCCLVDPKLILRRWFFKFFIIFEKWSGDSRVPVIAQENQVYHRKEHQKLWGSMSRMIHLMNFSHWKLGSKGARLCRQEEPPLGSLAVACHLEESASHHLGQRGHRKPNRRNPLWRLWRAPVTWRRVLRTIFYDFSWFSENVPVSQCTP